MTLRFIASINWSKATFPFNRTKTSCHGLQLTSSTRCGTLTDTEFYPRPLDTPRYINMQISQYVRLPHILWIIMSVHCTQSLYFILYCTLMVRSFSYFILMFLDFCSGCFLFSFTFYRYTQNTKANSFIIIVKIS